MKKGRFDLRAALVADKPTPITKQPSVNSNRDRSPYITRDAGVPFVKIVAETGNGVSRSRIESRTPDLNRTPDLKNSIVNDLAHSEDRSQTGGLNEKAMKPKVVDARPREDKPPSSLAKIRGMFVKKVTDTQSKSTKTKNSAVTSGVATPA